MQQELDKVKDEEERRKTSFAGLTKAIDKMPKYRLQNVNESMPTDATREKNGD